MRRRKTLRVIVAAKATIVWSGDHWATSNKSDTINCNGLNLWFADLQTEELPSDSVVEFTFFWFEAQRWEGRNWQISIGEH
jgi:glucoamylase